MSMKRLLLLLALCACLSACSFGAAAPEAASESHAASEPDAMPRTVLQEDENCFFSVDRISGDNEGGYFLWVTCENRTSKTLMFTWGDTTINGYVTDPYWTVQAAPGECLSSKINFSGRVLQRCAITSVDEIVFRLRVYDAADHKAGYLVDKSCSLYPSGLDAHTVVYPPRPVTEGEQIFADNASCLFVIQRSYLDPTWGYVVDCYMENRANHALLFSWDDTQVNGESMDPLWGVEIPPGKRACSSVIFLAFMLEECGVHTVREIDFTLHIFNSDDWSEPAAVKEQFFYKP